MGILEFISQLISSLAWPVMIIIIALVFKKPLLGLIEKVKNINVGNFAAEFQQKLDDISTIPTLPAQKKSDQIKLSFNQEIEEIAKISPEAAISLAWSKIEYAIKEKEKELRIFAIENEFSFSVIRIIELMQKQGKIDEKESKAIITMYQLRNSVIHNIGSNEIKINKDIASNYGNNAESIIYYINGIK
jgi:hypothetical protein